METGFEPVVVQLCRLLLWAAQPLHRVSQGYTPIRADDEIRTRDPHLGKVMLYQLSHIRVVHFRGLDHYTRLARPLQTTATVSGFCRG